jgi:acyl-homoserine lactone acylase PvdQ
LAAGGLSFTPLPGGIILKIRKPCCTTQRWTGRRTLLIKEPNSKWFDSKTTPVCGTATDILSASFIASVNELVKNHGNIGKAWQWGKVKPFEGAGI